jgi:hypothetical protein
MAIFFGCEVASGVLKPVATSFWQFSLFSFIGTVGFCNFGIIRYQRKKNFDVKLWQKEVDSLYIPYFFI